MPQLPQVATLEASWVSATVVRYMQVQPCKFDPICFDADKLSASGQLDGVAEAGRGNTFFFTLQRYALVLRHYRRGGMVRHISQCHYLYLGMPRTRAFREFDLLLYLQQTELPAPRPYACCVRKHSLFYTASLVTYRIAGRTLAECLRHEQQLSRNAAENEQFWRSIGQTIARFHAAGVCHADLNAHNIMIGGDKVVSLIDFDRGSIRTVPAEPVKSGWCLSNMDRLQRSLQKIAGSVTGGMHDSGSSNDVGFQLCKQQWGESLRDAVI